MPSTGLILLVIALVFLVMTGRGVRAAGRWLPQHRIWLTIVAIFLLVALLLTLQARHIQAL